LINNGLTDHNCFVLSRNIGLEAASEDEAGPALFESLRHIWDALGAVQIGRLQVGDRIIEQINPVEAQVRKILCVASAPFDARARKRLRIRA